MATERKSRVTYTANGTQSVFTFPFEYLRKTFIKVSIDGTPLVYGTDYSVVGSQVELINTPEEGATVDIYRLTTSERIVTWADASVLREADLTTFEVQTLHLAEEEADRAITAEEGLQAQIGPNLSILVAEAQAAAATATQALSDVINVQNNVEVVVEGITEEAIEARDIALSAAAQITMERNSKALWKLRSNANANSLWANGFKGISILGDSISHGAFAENIYRNSWVRLLQRMINAVTGSNSYGFTPYLTLGSGQPYASTEIHAVGFYGTWAAITGANASEYMAGLAYESSVLNDHLIFTVPTFQRRALIWYKQQPGGGTFDVYVNGTLAVSVTTDGALDYFKTKEIVILDNGYGKCAININVSSSGLPVVFTGISYLSGKLEPTVNNFATSGRQLRYVSRNVIDEVMAHSSCLILALGQNDYSLCDSDAAYYAEFKNRIDWIITEANANNVKVIVADFCWAALPSNKARIELKRCAADCKNGTYIDFPFILSNGYQVPITSDYQINILKMFIDGAHPNIGGQGFIAETIAVDMSLSCSSKADALNLYDYWFPLELVPAVDVENSLDSSDTISAVKKICSALLVKLYLQKAATGSFPVGTYVIQTAWPTKTGLAGMLQTVTTAALFRTDTSALTGTIKIDTGGQITLVITDGSWVNDQPIVVVCPTV